MISGHVCSPVLDADPRLAVVEVPPVELEELDEEDGQVGLMGLGVRSGVELEEAHSHKDKRIRRQTTREHLEEKTDIAMNGGYVKGIRKFIHYPSLTC